MEDEIWKDVVGYEDRFKISNKGRLFGKISNRILSQNKTKKGYMTHVTRVSGKAINFRIHRLVAEAFLLNTNNKPFVNHIDGIKSNNFATNLEWVTAKENTVHAVKMGLFISSRKGASKKTLSKLGEDSVQYILLNYKKGCRTNGEVALSKKFGIDRKTIKRILDIKI